jgi:hypothetical protein
MSVTSGVVSKVKIVSDPKCSTGDPAAGFRCGVLSNDHELIPTHSSTIMSVGDSSSKTLQMLEMGCP